MADLYISNNPQVIPFPEKQGNIISEAVDDTLFQRGFEDDVTPLDQYNLNLLIRAIKENLIRIEDIKQNYLTIHTLLDFLQSGTSTTITNPITFDSPISAITPEIGTDSTSSVVTVKYVNDILDALVLRIDGGTANDVNTIN